MSSFNAKILSGKLLSSFYERKICSLVEEQKNKGRRPPGLGVILVGENPASSAYVKNKEKRAIACGFYTKNYHMPSETTQKELEEIIFNLNNDEDIDGILLQLPLPKHLPAKEFLELIKPSKDVDGLHPYNQGKLLSGDEEIVPCTPLGILKLIDLAYSPLQLSENSPYTVVDQIKPKDLSGLSAVVVGRSSLVGKPVSILLLNRNATVTIAHSRTKNLEELCKNADILVSAAGVEGLIGLKHVNNRQVVIDVGINKTKEGKLAGDVNFKETCPAVKAITPVPGGVGPMTVIMLLCNTLKQYLKNMGINEKDSSLQQP